MNRLKWPVRIIFTLLFAAAANSYLFLGINVGLWICSFMVFLLVNIFAGFTDTTVPTVRLKICSHGAESLLIFLSSCLLSFAAQSAAIITVQPDTRAALVSIILCVLAHILLFWNGIISVYCTSVQLGIKLRALELICGMIPIVNIIVLIKIVCIALCEVRDETEKFRLNSTRAEMELCKTKYPLLLVHGICLRDMKLMNAWGRIPHQLEINGAIVYYGNHQSAIAVPDSARELAERMKQLVEETGCEKLNVIAHSKGGLDCRYAIEHFGCGQYIASLTTVSTPHGGCEFADYLLGKIPERTQRKISGAYNRVARRLGDPSPDFMAAVHWLTADSCKEHFSGMKNPDGIYCQSVGSIIKKMSHGKFPTNLAHGLIMQFEGDNDGLVAEAAFRWGDDYTLLTTEGDRGISHGDMIDLNRENIPGFDVREFYVQLVADIKEKGL